MTNTRPVNRKEQILGLAMELLQTKGYQAFSYHDLAAQLGITKASIHHHFPKKSDLGVALCESIQRWHDREYAKVRAVEGAVLDKIDFYINHSVRLACGDDMVCPLSSLQADVACLPDAMTSAMKSMDEQEIDFMAELLAEGRRTGELNFQGPVRAQAVVAVLTFKGALLYARSHGRELFDEAVGQLHRQLKGPAA